MKRQPSIDGAAGLDLFGEAAHDPGGAVVLPLPAGVFGEAVYDGPGDCYRYTASYTQSLAQVTRTLMLCMMNPSMAGAHCFDPTVAKVWGIGRRLGFNRLLVGNAHAYRAKDQNRLLEIEDPIGPKNDEHLLAMAGAADFIIMAYGTPRAPKLRDRGPAVARMFIANGYSLHAFKLSKNGVPFHPLYLPNNIEPKAWDGPDEAI